MRKLSILLLAVFALTANVEKGHAQTTESSKSKKQIPQNWFIGMGGGISTYFGESDLDVPGGYQHLITPNLNLQVGNWFTPSIGVRLQAGGMQLKGWNPSKTGGYYQKMNYFDLHGDLLLNPENLINGYNADRKLNWTLFAGAGAAKVFHKNTVPASICTEIKAGTMLDYKLSKAFSIFGEIQGTIVPENFDGQIGGSHKEGYATVSAGIIYRLPSAQKGIKIKETDVTTQDNKVLNDKINELLAAQKELTNKNSDLQQQNAQLQSAAAAAATKQPQTAVPAETAWPEGSKLLLKNYVRFASNKSVYLPGEESNIKAAADELSKRNDAIIEIAGYADPKTGTQSYNMQLSNKRAKYVADILKTKYNVSADKIVVSSYGNSKSPLTDNSKNKIVIFFLKKK